MFIFAVKVHENGAYVRAKCYRSFKKNCEPHKLKVCMLSFELMP